MHGHIISDLTVAAPSNALACEPLADRWLVLPYEGDLVSGNMLWSPPRNQPPDVSIPLPAAGLCRIYIGVYGSGTVPIWYNLYNPKWGTKTWNRVHLRLSDEEWFDHILPDDFPGEPRFNYISEAYWKTANLTGQSLVLAPPRKEAFSDMTASIAYVRVVPVTEPERWPRDTKRLVAYFDSNFYGHYVDSVADVKSHLAPLRDSDFDTVLWTTCREDSCYYPTNIGNRLSDIGTRMGVYPYWAGRDMERMLARGDDPLRVACEVAHENGLKFFASYRRMTCRMPPFVFPLHPNALMVRRHDLWCRDERGGPVPHLSLTQPEVRTLMISLLVEQAENYDLDGVHLFFCRGVPFVFFEQPFLDAFQGRHGCDPRTLPIDDPRVWDLRAHFVVGFLRELRAALDAVGTKKRKRLEVAMHVFNTPRHCAFYGMDIETIVRERLVDILLPSHAVFLPPEIGDWHINAERIAEFAKITKGTGVRLCPECEDKYADDGLTPAERTAKAYAAGAGGLNVAANRGFRGRWAVARRLGHVSQLERAVEWSQDASRLVRIETVAGFRLDHQYGIPTVG